MKIIIECKNAPTTANIKDVLFNVQIEQTDGLLKPEIYGELIHKLNEIKEIMNLNQSLIFQPIHV
ncbi:hypothetical protein FA048_11860 [Pedobacter polaris]|uniref:Uncharacterized protein n=1 Tax=Pedobacter polaris TaxID=2571273 RepID=A0A4U1CTE9_9SPHI|nr:hypothetical protein [Pedobacter polaris]TKC10856.1 hypothetical protein FA048_11860 [Pedobacter polaris]